MARGDFPSAKQDQFVLRFPEGLRDTIKGVADQNGRSMNAEIIGRLEKSFEDPSDLPHELMERIRQRASATRVPARSLIVNALEEAFPYGYTLGAFVDTWVNQVVELRSIEQRRLVIRQANEHPASIAAGLSMKENTFEDGEAEIHVYQLDGQMSGKIVAILPVGSLGVF